MCYLHVTCPDASIAHASDTGQLPANPPVAGPRHFPGKCIWWAVTIMSLIGEDHIVEPGYQRYDWQTGRAR